MPITPFSPAKPAAQDAVREARLDLAAAFRWAARLGFHEGTMRILHTLKPLGVAMAGENEFDPYKD